MSFPEFSYSPQMQLILFFVSTIATLVQTWCELRFIAALYDMAADIKKKLLLLSVVLTLLYNGSIYGIFALGSFQRFDSVWAEVLLITPTPFLAAAGYFIARRLWRMSEYWLYNIFRQYYLFVLVVNPIGRMLSRAIVIKTPRYNYLSDVISVTLFMILCVTISLAGARIIQHRRFQIRLPRSLPPHKVRMMGVGFVICILAFLLVGYMELIYETVLGNLMICGSLVLILICDVMFTYKASLRYEIDSRNIQIGSLMRTVDSYTYLQQDFEQILKTYDGHLETGDLDAVVRYHESLIGKTIVSAQSLSIVQRITENPSLVALLLKKIDYAHQLNVNLLIPSLCPLGNMHMEDFDLGRMLNNLLNNAIEAASVSRSRQAAFSVMEKSSASKLIVISNSTDEDIDTDAIMNHGVTTKQDHMGIGLTQVNNIMRKHSNATLNLSCDAHVFTARVQLWRAD